jgi:(2Fe-2S) ferredoxin
MTQKITKDYLDTCAKQPAKKTENCIKVGMSSCGIAAGAQKVFDMFNDIAEKQHIDITIKPCGCNGACHAEPLVEVAVEGLPVVTYGNVTPDNVLRIFEEHVIGKRMVHDLIVDMPVTRQVNV